MPNPITQEAILHKGRRLQELQARPYRRDPNHGDIYFSGRYNRYIAVTPHPAGRGYLFKHYSTCPCNGG